MSGEVAEPCAHKRVDWAVDGFGLCLDCLSAMERPGYNTVPPPKKGTVHSHRIVHFCGPKTEMVQGGTCADPECDPAAKDREIAALREMIVTCDRTMLRALSDLMGYEDGRNRPIQDDVRRALSLIRPVAEAEAKRALQEARG